MTDLASSHSIPSEPMQPETERLIAAALALLFGPTAIVVGIILLALFFASTAG